jgi:hypothetical protein
MLGQLNMVAMSCSVLQLLALHKLPSGHAGAQGAPLFFETIVNYSIKQKVGYILLTTLPVTTP